MSAKIRVVLADDHALLRDGLRALLARAEDIEVVGEAADGREAIAACERLSPDVIVLDIAMPGLGGLEAATEIRKAQPSVKILVLTQYEDREYVRRFLKIGISGYVLKRAAAADLTSAIRNVSRGGLVLDPAIARDALFESEGPSGNEDPYELLTDREKQVLRLVAEGRSNKEVASLLGISLKTSMTHREHLMLKLGLHNRTDLVRFALRKGVLPA